MSEPCECEQAGFECGARVYIGEPGKGYWTCKKQLDAVTSKLEEGDRQRAELITVLRHARNDLITDIFQDFRAIERLLLRAYDEHEADNLSEAERLLNQALDIESDVTGSCSILAPLAKEWGVEL